MKIVTTQLMFTFLIEKIVNVIELKQYSKTLKLMFYFKNNVLPDILNKKLQLYI